MGLRFDWLYESLVGIAVTFVVFWYLAMSFDCCLDYFVVFCLLLCAFVLVIVMGSC